MSFLVTLRPEAERDIEDAAGWYERHRRGLGYRFVDEIERMLANIAERPEMYPVVHEGVRRALTRQFPFGVFYRVEGDSIVVFAVLHASRHPAHWRDRS